MGALVGSAVSSFHCNVCGKAIIDSPAGYLSECIHWPAESKGKVRSYVDDDVILHMIDGRVNTIILDEPLRAYVQYPKRVKP
jgi:hypothetical protein